VSLQCWRRSDEEVLVADSSHRCLIGPEKAAGKLSDGEVMGTVELKGPLIELCGWGCLDVVDLRLGLCHGPRQMGTEEQEEEGESVGEDGGRGGRGWVGWGRW
jgi:hypothetical protein